MRSRLFLLVLLACSSHICAESFNRWLFALPNSNSVFVKLRTDKRSFMEEIDVETGKTVRKTQYDRYPFADYDDCISPDGKWYLIGLGMSYDGYRIPLLGGKQQRKRIFCGDEYLFSSHGKYVSTRTIIYQPPGFQKPLVLPNPSAQDRLFFRSDESKVLMTRVDRETRHPTCEIFNLPGLQSDGVFDLPGDRFQPIRWVDDQILFSQYGVGFWDCTLNQGKPLTVKFERRNFNLDKNANIIIGNDWYGIVRGKTGKVPANSRRHIWIENAETLPMTFSTYDYKTNQPRASITRDTMGRIFISPDGTKLAETTVNNPDEIILSSLDGTKRIAIPTKVITDEGEPTEQELKEERDWLTREEEEPPTIPSNPWPLIAGLAGLAVSSAFLLFYYLKRRRQIKKDSQSAVD